MEFRPWPKVSFRRFWFIGHGRNTVFSIFCISAMAESQFLAFSAFRRRPTNIFRCFLIFPHEGKPIFTIFLFSPVRES